MGLTWHGWKNQTAFSKLASVAGILSSNAMAHFLFAQVWGGHEVIVVQRNSNVMGHILSLGTTAYILPLMLMSMFPLAFIIQPGQVPAIGSSNM